MSAYLMFWYECFRELFPVNGAKVDIIIFNIIFVNEYRYGKVVVSRDRAAKPRCMKGFDRLA